MKLLLDTHTFLWFIEDSPRLSAKAKSLLESDEELLISAASLWEIAIKISIGKLTLTQPYKEFISDQLAKNYMGLLPIAVEHLALVSALPDFMIAPSVRRRPGQPERSTSGALSPDAK